MYIFNYSRYILADSTILDNSAVINFVNDKIKLELGSFIRIINSGVIIEYGTSRLLIVSHGTRVLKRVFNQGKRDLVLNNVAVIEGFHTNIVSEYKLRSSGV